MNHSDRRADESRRLFHPSQLWPGDTLELQWEGAWVAATYRFEEGHHVIVFQIDARTFGVTDVSQALEWGLRPVVH
jgi:hypothetical protein